MDESNYLNNENMKILFLIILYAVLIYLFSNSHENFATSGFGISLTIFIIIAVLISCGVALYHAE